MMDDLISRQAAIEAECAACSLNPPRERGHNCRYYVKGCPEVECLRNLPSAEPRWIPVTERPPDEMGTYLVTLDYKEHGKGVMSLWFHNEEIGWDLRVADAVTAWMPPPAPWKGEDDV